MQRLVVGTDGRIRFSYVLPSAAELTRGNGVVSITFFDGGNQETIVRPIPIVLGKMFVDFYPEGGDLVSGVSNRVYFQARTAADKPADLQGRIVDPAGAVVASIRTLTDGQEPGVNQGMGAFEITPRLNPRYELKIDSPTGMHRHGRRPALCAACRQGRRRRVAPSQGSCGRHDRLEVTSADKDRRLMVGAYCRGNFLTRSMWMRWQASVPRRRCVLPRPSAASNASRCSISRMGNCCRSRSVWFFASLLSYLA